MSNIQGLQAEFMAVAQQRIFTLREVLHTHGPNKQSELYINLIEEEFEELQKAFTSYANSDREDHRLACLADVLDAVADLAVVMMGLCNSLGLPFDAGFLEVHRSNMNKFVHEPDGTLKILKRADGKILKPNTWTPPNLLGLLRYYIIRGE